VDGETCERASDKAVHNRGQHLGHVYWLNLHDIKHIYYTTTKLNTLTTTESICIIPENDSSEAVSSSLDSAAPSEEVSPSPFSFESSTPSRAAASSTTSAPASSSTAVPAPSATTPVAIIGMATTPARAATPAPRNPPLPY